MPLESSMSRIPPGPTASAGYASGPHTPIDISRHTTTQLQTHLQTTAPSAPDFRGLLTQAMQHGDVAHREELIEVLLNHATCQAAPEMRPAILQAALQVAVSDIHDNSVNSTSDANLDMHMKLVSQVLTKIADQPSPPLSPSHIDQLDLGKTSHAMFSHLRYASKFLRLYSSACAPQATPEASGLRAALYKAFHNPSRISKEEVPSALNKEVMSLMSPELSNQIKETDNASGVLWGTARVSKNHDLQRAMLLFTPDRFSVPRNERGAVKDPVIKQMLKEIPYNSQPRATLQAATANPMLENLNCKVAFNDGTYDASLIACRHLAIHRIETQASHIRGKFRLHDGSSAFQGADAIQQHVGADTEKKFLALQENALENHLLCNTDFGKALIRQFKGMEARINQAAESEKQHESVQHILLVSPAHAMSLQLHIKKDERGKLQYVTQLYDPNVTFNHVRFAHTDLNALDRLTLKDLFNTHKMDVINYDHYYPQGHEVSIMHVAGTSAQARSLIKGLGPTQGAEHCRKLDSGIDAKNISGAAISHLLWLGFADALQALTPTVLETLANGRLDLLEAKNKKGCPGLFMALGSGRSEAIRRFGEWLGSVTDQNKLLRLLEAKSQEGIPGLYLALGAGQADAIRAFGALLDKVTDQDDLLQLLETKTSRGIPGLYAALCLNQAEAIQAFGTLLDKVTEQKIQIQLLEAKDPAGMPGLHAALRRGHADSVTAFGALLAKVHDADARFRLLEAKNAAGMPGLQASIDKIAQNQREPLITAFTALVDKYIPDEKQHTKLLQGFQ